MQQTRLSHAPAKEPETEHDRDVAAFNRANDTLRDQYDFSAFQIHAVHEAIREAGMELVLRQG